MSELAPPRLRVGVIGVGRVGSVMAAALQSAGHPVVAAHAVSEKSLDRVARFLPATDVVPVSDVIAAADLILVAVPDAEIESVVAGIAKTIGFRPGQFVIHPSGRHGLAILQPAVAQGAIALAIHPAMTFTGSLTDRARLQSCPFGVTATPETRAVAEALVVEMGGEPFWIKDQDRATYHAALSHASNHLNTIISQSRKILSDIGIDQPGIFLSPLVHTSAENALSLGLSTLTGPISRGDTETVSAHLAALVGSTVRDSYIQLAFATIELAESANRITSAQAFELRSVLGR